MTNSTPHVVVLIAPGTEEMEAVNSINICVAQDLL